MNDVNANDQGQTGESITVEYFEFEWNFDMDNMTSALSTDGNSIIGYKVKGRCKACWGSLIARTQKGTWKITGIKCRACGKMLEGIEAEEEDSRMSSEGNNNRFNLAYGLRPNYGEGTFLQKSFPQYDNYNEEDIKKRVRLKVAEGNKAGKLTRNSFPLGSPGLFLLQAQLLMEGLIGISNPEDFSVVVFDDIDFLDDGSVLVYPDVEGLKHDSKYFKNRLLRRMGANMTTAMISAFACELAMKAISLTCDDEAKRIHDLLELFESLPGESRSRIKIDFPEIESILEGRRQTFDSWRYFETNIGELAFSTMIDKPSAQALCKAARVILDECEIVGLHASVVMDAKQDVSQVGQQRTYHQSINIKVTGGENPPPL